jgi:hypothetical protein
MQCESSELKKANGQIDVRSAYANPRNLVTFKQTQREGRHENRSKKNRRPRPQEHMHKRRRQGAEEQDGKILIPTAKGSTDSRGGPTPRNPKKAGNNGGNNRSSAATCSPANRERPPRAQTGDATMLRRSGTYRSRGESRATAIEPAHSGGCAARYR